MKKIGLCLLLLSGAVFSHGIWLQIKSSGTVGQKADAHLYFGELQHGVVEKGLKWYDGAMFSGFKAYVKKPATKFKESIDLKVSETALTASFTPKNTGIYQVVAVNEEAPVRDVTSHGLGMLKDVSYFRTTYEATSWRAKQQGVLDLSPMMPYDIVPFPAKNGYGDYDSHQATYRKGEKVYATFYIDGKPALKKEVKVIARHGWYQIKKTNDKGQFSFTPNEVGFYQLAYQDKQQKNGTYKGKNYDTYRIKAITVVEVK